jgi:hypothetical protein
VRDQGIEWITHHGKFEIFPELTWAAALILPPCPVPPAFIEKETLAGIVTAMHVVVPVAAVFDFEAA